MSYWNEFRAGWRPLLGAAIGMGTGFSTTGVVTSIMAPHFIKELGWTPAAFAQVGATSILMSLFIPIAGRMADVLGVRRTAAIGILSLPLCMIALSRMSGGIGYYYIVFITQSAFAVMTTSTVYSRVVVTYFKRARGFAMAIAASAPGVTGIFAGFYLNSFVEVHGWRTGYLVTAAVTFTCGLIALALLPSRRQDATIAQASDAAAAVPAPPRQRSWGDYRVIVRNPAFWLLIVAMMLCNLYQTLAQAQINMLVLAKGVDKMGVGPIISAFSLSMVIGRFTCGVAIDRLPGRFVAAVGMGMPAVGLFMLASPFGTPAMVMTAMIFIGFAMGAEGDLIGVLVARTFGVGIYSSVMGLVTGAISLAVASGALTLSILLRVYGNYDVFLVVCGTAVLIGGVMFLFLPKSASAVPTAEAPHPALAAAA